MDDGGVLVRAGDRVDAEAAAAPIGEEAEVKPQPGCLHEDFGSIAVEKIVVAGHLDKFADRIGDGGIDVVLGGAGGIIRGRFLPIDRTPGVECAALADLSRSFPCGVQHAVAEQEEVPRGLGIGVDQERDHVHFCIPEIVTLVGLAGQSLRRDAGAVCPGGGLEKLEEVPAQALLRTGVRPADLDVGLAPEVVEVLPLVEKQAVKPARRRPGRARARPGRFAPRRRRSATCGT